MKHLEELRLYRNDLSGRLPDEIGDCPKLRRLDIVFNFLTGEIPESLGRLNNLTHLNMNINRFRGAVPASLSNPPLKVLDLEHNSLCGEFPPAIKARFDNHPEAPNTIFRILEGNDFPITRRKMDYEIEAEEAAAATEALEAEMEGENNEQGQLLGSR